MKIKQLSREQQNKALYFLNYLHNQAEEFMKDYDSNDMILELDDFWKQLEDNNLINEDLQLK